MICLLFLPVSDSLRLSLAPGHSRPICFCGHIDSSNVVKLPLLLPVGMCATEVRTHPECGLSLPSHDPQLKSQLLPWNAEMNPGAAASVRGEGKQNKTRCSARGSLSIHGKTECLHKWLRRTVMCYRMKPCLKKVLGCCKKGPTGLERWPMVKNTGCCSRGSRLNSQHLHGSSQLSVTPIPEDTATLTQTYITMVT